MEKERKRAPGAGRKPVSAAGLVAVNLTVTPQQREKLKALGGSAWLRARIDEAQAPGKDPK